MEDNLQELVSRLGVKGYPGSSITVGKAYHSLPFADLKVPIHREKTNLRVEKIMNNYNVWKKTGIDLGCNVGGITFGLQLMGAQMIGIDCDEDSINLAIEIEKRYKTGATFLCEDINLEFVTRKMKDCDFIIFFDCWMWIARKYGLEIAKKLLNEVSKHTPNLFFSTSQDDGKAKMKGIVVTEDVLTLLKGITKYKNYDSLGTVNDGWYPRTIFHCYI